MTLIESRDILLFENIFLLSDYSFIFFLEEVREVGLKITLVMILSLI